MDSSWGRDSPHTPPADILNRSQQLPRLYTIPDFGRYGCVGDAADTLGIKA